MALLGVGVAEHAGFITAVLESMPGFTPRSLPTPMPVLVAIVSHSAADAGCVPVIPLGGVIFHAAGRHPLAGIAAASGGVSGGRSAAGPRRPRPFPLGALHGAAAGGEKR